MTTNLNHHHLSIKIGEDVLLVHRDSIAHDSEGEDHHTNGPLTDITTVTV